MSTKSVRIKSAVNYIFIFERGTQLRKETALSKWVEKFGGKQKLAATLKVTPFAVRTWMVGRNTPTAEKINELIKLSKGKLSFQQIYESTTYDRKSVKAKSKPVKKVKKVSKRVKASKRPSQRK